MRNKALEYLLVGVASYYLLKGLIYLIMHQAMVHMEIKGKQRVAKEREDRRRKRELRDQKARDNWKSNS